MYVMYFFSYSSHRWNCYCDYYNLYLDLRYSTNAKGKVQLKNLLTRTYDGTAYAY